MKEFKRRILEIKFEGEMHVVSFPSNRKLQDYLKSKKENETDGDSLDSLIVFLDTLGLPSSAAWEMEPYMLEEIFEEFKQKKR